MKNLFKIFLFGFPVIVFAQIDQEKYEYYIEKSEKFDNSSQKYQKYLDSAVMILPQEANLWTIKSIPYFKNKKYEKGMVYLDKAVTLDEKNNIAYRAFIKCIFSKQYSESIYDFEKAKKIIGNDGVIMDHFFDFYIGLCYIQLDDFKQAEYYINKSITIYTKKFGGTGNYLENFYLGIINYENEKYEKAIIYFNRSLSDYKNFSDAKFYKARSLNYLHNDDFIALLIEAKNDNLHGFTINEGNSVYEEYPYQVKLSFINLILDALSKNSLKINEK